ncbi:MAG TPA: hypothetical protein VFP24_08525 [Gaiellaceae bacterium]|jgi:hypothetical protein|nr:hypothetical protein [Gaiellaceae bacterium]
MHLRLPAFDRGATSFAWAVFFFLFLWLGMLAVGIDGATAFIISAVAGCAIFLYVRLFGEDEITPRRRAQSTNKRAGAP